MESTTLRRAPSLPQATLVSLIFGLLLLAAVSWALTDDRMGGMDGGPGTDPGSLGFFVSTWVVMMAAMMFPSILPMVLMFARVQEGKRDRGGEAPAGVVTAFVAGYVVTWATAGLVGYALVELVRTLDIGVLAWGEAGPYVAGGVILAAAIYQLTPLKDACLTKCRSPLAFLLTSWRPGRLGALRMGVEHGAWCVGCCWALMAALFALGVMSIGWMAFVAALIAAEKLAPWKGLANRGIAIVLAVLGLAVAFAPEHVPGLTIPNSPEAVRAMEAMGMEGEPVEAAPSMDAIDDEMPGSVEMPGSNEMPGAGGMPGSGMPGGG